VNGTDDRQRRQPSIIVQTTWRPGIRTPAWDALWRQIFADLGDVLDEPLTDDEVDGFDVGLPAVTSHDHEV